MAKFPLYALSGYNNALGIVNNTVFVAGKTMGINMIKIMFVCHGNICRSPMAEFVLKDMVKRRGFQNDYVISSSATSTEEIWNGVGNPVYPPARAVLEAHGIDPNGKRAVQLKASDYDKYDLFIGMDRQ